jgi:uncharacterized protein (DUF2062 family)
VRELLGLALAVEITVAVGVLIYVVTVAVVTWFADRRIAAVREKAERRIKELGG